MKVTLKDILFWITLILGLILVIWNVFGNSPTEFIALATLIVAVLFQVWRTSDRQIRLEERFNYMGRDFKKLSEDFKQHIKYK